MRLILTEFVSSLKEDQELDRLIQEFLRADGIEIFSKPERGRQHGVDIYAVGPDADDNNIRKVFLITVKQGDLDRRTWNVELNSVRPSVDEIITVFIRNNLASEHKNLPIKIIVAFNGVFKQSLQQDWRGYTERYPEYEMVAWGLDNLVNRIEQKIFNEDAFSGEIRSLIRRTIIYLSDPDYDLIDFSKLLELLCQGFRTQESKNAKIKLLKQFHFILEVIVKHAAVENNLKHALKCSEKYLLVLWNEIDRIENSSPYIGELVSAYIQRSNIQLRFINKLGSVALVKDGYSKYSSDSISYTYVLYEHLSFLSLAGLEFLQLATLFKIRDNEDLTEMANAYKSQAINIMDLVLRAIENNTIFYSPRADSHMIEINLVLILLYKLDRKKDIQIILNEFNEQLAEGLIFSNLFPVFTNDKREIVELEINYKKRLSFDYQSSNLLACLIEWTVVMNDEDLYHKYRLLKQKLLPELDLVLWFPKEIEDAFYNSNIMSNGYSLTIFTLPESFEEFKNITYKDYNSNKMENEIPFIKHGQWLIGLVACRHFRTYIFPYYWRQFLDDDLMSASLPEIA